eukprot:CAMPEP_0173243668 /NCGR_PEP_ID=MMETSP1142-20121109/15641_1 /TAXON_ID=483371 /ORGANISM="non described non described, Strain CCMP2298" /LENGTH=231 /DNA_ID=CAMNT_0014175309 /DNA_START=106 /DNA_END=800 /DNA_ORIENTATION=+
MDNKDSLFSVPEGCWLGSKGIAATPGITRGSAAAVAGALLVLIVQLFVRAVRSHCARVHQVVEINVRGGEGGVADVGVVRAGQEQGVYALRAARRHVMVQAALLQLEGVLRRPPALVLSGVGGQGGGDAGAVGVGGDPGARGRGVLVGQEALGGSQADHLQELASDELQVLLEAAHSTLRQHRQQLVYTGNRGYLHKPLLVCIDGSLQHRLRDGAVDGQQPQGQLEAGRAR